ncbi:hypothetical protein LB450_08430 [Psychroflexus sp. CAK1W]|uniref:hypothetical protein n=1 Tax=Psychroflexus curvus TaxID=2873595 RepID=UPI001CC95153|nr:hypothetical protein [Psychroflexus curvus]MBZ9628122.1 hypothetical protein [Psychroflexus curvus]
MKKSILLIISALFIIPFNSKAQDEGAIAAVAGGLLAIGVGIAAVEQMKEHAELTATEWLLKNHSEFDKFSLKTLDFDGKKLKDLSSTSVISYKIRKFEIEGDEPKFGAKHVLFGFTSYGWVSEYGINFDKIKWLLVDKEEWLNMMATYTKLASNVNDDNIIREALKNGKVVNKRIKVNNGDNIDFLKLEGDMYLVANYSPDMKFIYNERSFGIYLKETMNLIQIARGNLIDIHEFFYDK